MKKLTGQCLCGAITYEINGPLGPIVNCHCNMCRRWHGAAFRTRSTVEKKYFSWVKGEDNLATFQSSKHVVKTFCRTCGSNLISLYDDKPEHIGLPIGGLDVAPDNKPEAHIFVGSKSPWFEITDDLPQYEGLPSREVDTVLFDRKQNNNNN